MADPKKRVPLKEAIRQAFKDAGESLAETLAGDSDETSTSGSGGVTINLQGAGLSQNQTADDEGEADKRITALEEGQKEMKGTLDKIASTLDSLSKMSTKDSDDEPPKKKEDDEGKKTADDDGDDDDTGSKQTTDSAALATSFQSVLADAEVLVPGLRLPTFDAALPRAKTVDAMCSLRRSVMTQLQATTAGAALLGSMGEAETDFGKADCAGIAATFRAASILRRASNNAKTTDGASKVPAGAAITGKLKAGPSPADMNKANAEFWQKQLGQTA